MKDEHDQKPTETPNSADKYIGKVCPEVLELLRMFKEVPPPKGIRVTIKGMPTRSEEPLVPDEEG